MQNKGLTKQGVWLAKHWGLAIGSIMGFGGLCLAVPGNMVTWSKYQQTNNILGVSYTTEQYAPINSPPPFGFKLVGILPDSHSVKGLGASLALLGSTILFMSANSLKKEYERLEFTNWQIRQSEFELTDYEYGQSVEVDRYAIDLQYQQQISNMLNPPVAYHPEELTSPEDQPRLKAEPEFSRTCTGFLAWLKQEKFQKFENKFVVRVLAQQSFPQKKLSTEEIRSFVDELVQVEQVSWLDEEKSSFRLLNS
ncbi:hypothetical protein G7B40_041085 [Aetokthonos hydrillicola Thurmond2011]|jgi:hypothetical protein|uniref:Uncharacterized protein n=1 Tax=Aetokthonos hydrillicola Thurmond2011 TaxID=2712845 RepID=A0AAP5IHN7_9CYAN|nr:hypothetical protein [Aetokthonos hydrillicola]MBO3463016.1 hypothetical protein [Aetokthonos hydrillicola CCALA 1050]MBW4590833.1 hypothetical protein [Aetokthonos hydrillicola CCALA 1050]MDR9900882.1 hypothetical protein [Aetokthonos hydrillicola Thurmond2011]